MSAEPRTTVDLPFSPEQLRTEWEQMHAEHQARLEEPDRSEGIMALDAMIGRTLGSYGRQPTKEEARTVMLELRRLMRRLEAAIAVVEAKQ